MSRKYIIAALITLSATSSVMADSSMVATLASPTIKQDQILDGTIWRCAETTCRSVSSSVETGVQACKDVAKRFGQIVSFVSNGSELDAAQLTKCNASAKAS